MATYTGVQFFRGHGVGVGLYMNSSGVARGSGGEGAAQGGNQDGAAKMEVILGMTTATQKWE